MRTLLGFALALAILAPHAAALGPVPLPRDVAVPVVENVASRPFEVAGPVVPLLPEPVRAALPQPYPTPAVVAPDAPVPEPDQFALYAGAEPAAATPEVPVPPLAAFPRDEPVPPLEALRPFPEPAPISYNVASPAPEPVARGEVVPEAAGLAAGLVLLAGVLYVRLAPSAALASPARQRIADHVRSDPGCTAGAVARALGLDYKTALHHLRVLRRAGCLMVLDGPQERYFVAGALPSSHMPRAVVLRSPAAQALRGALMARPARAADLARQLGISETTASVQLRRLAAAGLVVRGPDGRWAPAS